MALDPNDPIVALINSKTRPAIADFFDEQLLAVDADAGTAHLSFIAGSDICTERHAVHGGFLAAMLDQAMTMAALASRHFEEAIPTLAMKISHVQPAQPGRLEAQASIVHAGRKLCFLEGRLYGGDGELCASANATCRFINVAPF